MQGLGKMLVIFGFLIAGVGALLMLTDKIPFLGKLPGDINIRKDNFQLVIPVTTSLLLSVIVSAVLWLISYLTRK
jgi:hypothetical protein